MNGKDKDGNVIPVTTTTTAVESEKEAPATKVDITQALEYDQGVLLEANNKLKSDQQLLKKQLDKAKKDLATSVPSTEVERMETELKELSELKKQMEAKEEAEVLAQKKDEVDRIKYLHEKELAKIQTEMTALKDALQANEATQKERADQYQSELSTLRSIQLENDIFSASKDLAYSPKQIVLLLKNDFKYDEELHRYVYQVTNDKGKVVDEVSVAEHVKEFLAKEENDNLALAPTGKTSVGTPVNSDGVHTTVPTNSSIGKTDSHSTAADLQKEAALRDFSVETWAELKKVKAEIVARKRKERQNR